MSIDKLLIVNQTGEGLMARLHSYRNFALPEEIMSNTEEVFARMNKVFKDYDKDFDRIRGADAYHKKATDIRAQLEDYYLTFVDVVTWREAALDLLVEVEQGNRQFKFKDSGFVISEYMKLWVRYIQLHYLVCSVQKRRGFLVYFVKAHDLHGNSEPNFKQLSDFIVDYDMPHLVKKLREDLAPTRGRVGAILQDVQQYLMKWQGVDMIHAKAIFNMLDHPANMRFESNEEELLQLEYLRSFQLWTIFGYLFAPECIAAAEGMAEMCTTALNLCLKDSFVVPIFREESINVHEEFKNLFYNFTCAWPPNQTKKKFKLHASKFKKPYDLVANDPDSVYNDRATFRTMLRGNMQNMLDCFDAFPHTIAPKLSMINSAVVLARWELETYFRLIKTPHLKAKRGWKMKLDAQIPALIHLVKELRTRVEDTHNDDITSYYRSYLSNADLQELSQLQDNFRRDVPNASQATVGLWERVLDDCKNAENKKEFSGLRMNCYRLLLNTTLNTGGANPHVTGYTCPALTRVIRHAKRIDGSKIFSLGDLFWFPDLLREVLQTCLTPETFGLESVGQACFVISVVSLLSDGIDNVRTLCPEEDLKIGKKGYGLAQEFIVAIVKSINDRIIAGSHGMFAERTRLSRLAGPDGVLTRMRRQAKALTDGTERSFFVMPGTESLWKYRQTGHNRTLNKIKRELRELVRAIESVDHVVVYTYQFCPREYLIEIMGVCINNSLHQCISAKSGGHNIQRPSLALASFIEVVSAWQHVAASSRVDVSMIVKQQLADEFNDETVGEPGKEFKARAEEEKRANNDRPAVHVICDWYKSYFRGDLSNIGAAYCPTVRAFVGVRSGLNEDANSEIPFGEHTDPKELQSLCILMGPQGIRALDRALLTIVGENVSIIRDKLERNAVTLNSFQGPGTELELWKEITSKISEFDALMDAAVTMGCVIKFRELLRAAMGTVLKSDVPFLQQVVGLAGEAIPTINRSDPHFKEINRLATDFGLEVGEADIALQFEMTKHRGNPGTWNLLPEAFGVIFLADRWKSAKYSVRLDGHTNNAHMMVDSLHALIIYMTKASLNDPVKVNDHIQKQSETFVRMASNSLLHMMGLNESPARMWQIRNMMVVLEKFITSTDRLHLSLLDDCFPYTLIRTNYVALYEAEDSSSAYGGPEATEEKEGETKPGLLARQNTSVGK